MKRVRPGSIDFVAPLWQCLDLWSASRQAFSLQTQALFEAWVRCRAADLEQGMKLYESLIGCKDPAEMLRQQQRWLADAAGRLQAELDDYHSKAVSLAKQGVATDAAPPATPERDAAE